jgi:hypothetical protein
LHNHPSLQYIDINLTSNLLTNEGAYTIEENLKKIAQKHNYNCLKLEALTLNLK